MDVDKWWIKCAHARGRALPIGHRNPLKKGNFRLFLELSEQNDVSVWLNLGYYEAYWLLIDMHKC